MVVLQVATIDDGRMTQVIGNLERELQAKVDAKMKLASDSHVYERLSEDIKSKAAILAALKATLGPVTDLVRVEHDETLPVIDFGIKLVSLLRETCYLRDCVKTACENRLGAHTHPQIGKNLHLQSARLL